MPRGRGGDRARHPARDELGDELRDAADEGRPGGGQSPVVLLLARSQTLRLGPRRRATQEQRHGLDARTADRQPPVVGLGGNHAQLAEECPPGRSVMRSGIDQHAVHVEDDSAGLHA